MRLAGGILLGWLVAAGGPATEEARGQSETTVVFRQGLNGYTGTTDAMLQQGSPGTAAGTGPTMDVVGGTATKQSLLKFANIIGTGTNQIPANAQIVDAKLELSVWTAGSGVAVHRMNKAWTETSTWTSMVNGLQIGDEEAHWSAVDTKTNLPRGLAVFDVTTTVQEWANGAETNEGWALLPTDGSSTAVQIDTRESTYSSGKSWEIKPTLRVTYRGGGGGGGSPPTITAVSPVDGAPGVGAGGVVPLEVALADADNDALTVTFYGREKAAATTQAGEDFTLVMVPDTQFYSENGSRGKITDFRNMTTWIVNNRQALNIQFVAHMGDMVQNRDDDEQEWINADSAMDIIENPTTTGLPPGIPWGGAPGNHDQNRSGGANRFWNQYFGNARWSGKTYYRGGYTDGTSDANYQFFSASGMDFIVINMEYRPSAAMIAWADALIKANPTRRAIVTSHEILQAHLDAGTPVDQAPYYGQGRAIYEGLRNNPNFFLMLCGHWHGEGRRTETWQGRQIHAILANYQTEVNGGDTWLRYLVFSPRNQTITSNVIRTRDGARRTGNDSQFTVSYPMGGGEAPWTAVGTLSRPAGSTTATVNWTGLTTGKTYEWYAAATDGGTPVSTAVRSFTVGNNAAPTVSLTAPADGSTVTRPDKVNFTATAADSDGTVVRVEFLQGTTKVGEDTTAPYSFSWDAPAGTYSLTAVAVDNGGARTPSTARTVTVRNSGGGTPVAPTIGALYPAADSPGAGGSQRVNLQVEVADGNGDPLTVSFYGRPKATSGGGEDFTLAVMPDTQHYTENNGQYISGWRAQSTWLVNNRVAQNVVYVAHVGDVTELFDEEEYEWVLADGVMKIIENPATTSLTHGIPWGAVPGNHDLASSGSRGPNDYYNVYFGPSRFAGRPYFGGGITTNDNHCSYTLFTAGGMDFVVVNLRYSPTSAMITWGDSILKQFPNRRGIVTSHEIINDNGAGWSGRGQAIFDGLKNNPNLFLMLCGHKHESTGENRRSDTVNGRTIHTVIQDYQDRSSGGGGWFRLFRFSPTNNTISVRTLQATTGNYETDANSQFTLTYPMSGGGGGGTPAPWTTLGTVQLPAGAPTASLDWTGLTAGTAYEWYAAVSDGGTPVSTAARSFVLADNPAPTVSLTAPASGATINLPDPVAFAATASDAGGVTKVEFYAGLLKVGEDATSPYTLAWAAPEGTYSVTAVAVDNLGARTATASRTVSVVSGNQAPTVTLTSPTPGQVVPVPGPVLLAATAADGDGTVARVEFYEGANRIGEDTTAPYSLSWEVGPGTYQVSAEAVDDDGARTRSGAVTVTVRNQAPTVAITQPAAGATFRAGNAVVIRADPEDADGTIARVEYFAGSLRLGQRSTSPYQLTWSNAPVGTHVLTAVAEDNYGERTTSAGISVTVQANQAPAVSLAAPTNGAVIALPDPVEMRAEATDADGTVAKVEFFAGTSLLGESTAAPHTFRWSAPPGTHELTAVATDNDGATTRSAARTVTVSNRAPQVALTQPGEGTEIVLPATVELAATATDPDGAVATVEFYRGTTKIGEDAVEPYGLSWTAPPGTHLLKARALDNHGAATETPAVTVTVRNPAPTVAISAPTPNAELNLPGPFAIAVLADDADGSVVRVEFFANGNKLGEKTQAPFAWDWTPLSGLYVLRAVAHDNLGAQTTSADVAVTVANPNNRAPTVAVTSPGNGATLRAGSTLAVSASAEDADGGVAKVEFFVGEEKIGEDTTAPFGVSWMGVPAGTHVLTARATDNDGGQGTSLAVTISAVANQPPTVAWTAPPNGSETTQTPLTLEATASDADGTIAKVEFFRAGVKIGEDTAAPFRLVWSNVTAGRHTLHALATDAEGAATPSRPVAVRVALPTAGTSSFRDGANGYSGTRDTQIHRGFPTNTYASATSLGVDANDGSSATGNNPVQALLRFEGIFGEQSHQIPPGSTITSATLTLQVNNSGSGFAVHRMLADWTDTNATWNSFDQGIAADGVEAVATATATVGANSDAANVSTGPLNLNVTSAVQAWADGSPNQGLVLLPWPLGVNGVDFYAREWSNASQRPTLSVSWVSPVVPPEAPPGLMIHEVHNGLSAVWPAGDPWLPDEWLEMLLTRDHTAEQLEAYRFGDSTQFTTAKTSVFAFTNLASLAPVFRAGTLVTVGGAGSPEDLTYAPAEGESDDHWNLRLTVGGAHVRLVEREGTNHFGPAPRNDVIWVDEAHTGLNDLAVTHGVGWDDPSVNGLGTFTLQGTPLALADVVLEEGTTLAFAGGSGEWFAGPRFVLTPTGTSSPGLPNPQGGSAAYVALLRGTTLTNPVLPQVLLAAPAVAARELGPVQSRSLRFRILRTGATTQALAVPLRAAGTARVAVDYTGWITPVQIPAGQKSAELVLTALPDSLPEGPETVIVSLAPSEDFSRGSPAEVTGTILDRPFHRWMHDRLASDSPFRQHGLDRPEDAAEVRTRLFEFFHGTAAAPAADAPPPFRLEGKEGRTLRLRYLRSKQAVEDVIPTMRWSRDLLTWHSNGATDGNLQVRMSEMVVSGGTEDQETVESTATLEGAAADEAPRLFFRIQLEPVPSPAAEGNP